MPSLLQKMRNKKRDSHNKLEDAGHDLAKSLNEHSRSSSRGERQLSSPFVDPESKGQHSSPPTQNGGLGSPGTIATSPTNHGSTVPGANSSTSTPSGNSLSLPNSHGSSSNNPNNPAPMQAGPIGQANQAVAGQASGFINNSQLGQIAHGSGSGGLQQLSQHLPGMPQRMSQIAQNGIHHLSPGQSTSRQTSPNQGNLDQFGKPANSDQSVPSQYSSHGLEAPAPSQSGVQAYGPTNVQSPSTNMEPNSRSIPAVESRENSESYHNQQSRKQFSSPQPQSANDNTQFSPRTVDSLREHDRNFQQRYRQAPTEAPAQYFETSNSDTPWTEWHIRRACPSARFGHSANYIAARDGELFVMGGIRDMDILSDLWVIDTNMLTGYQLVTDGAKVGPRVGHSSLVLGNAHVVFGGDTKIEETDPLDDNLYLLNTSTLKWAVATCAGPRPCGRYGHSMSNIGSRIYVFGGQVDDKFYDDMWCFELTKWRSSVSGWDLISPTTPPPPPRTNHTVVTYKDKLYLFGGANGELWYSDTWCYDPTTNAWTQLDCTGYVPAPCQGHAATLIGDVMYVFGGMSSQGNLIDQLFALRLTSLKWYTFQNLGPGPTPRSGHSLTAFDEDKILVWGGTDQSNSAFILDTSLINYPDESGAALPTGTGNPRASGVTSSVPSGSQKDTNANRRSLVPEVDPPQVPPTPQQKPSAAARNSMLFSKRGSVLVTSPGLSPVRSSAPAISGQQSPKQTRELAGAHLPGKEQSTLEQESGDDDRFASAVDLSSKSGSEPATVTAGNTLQQPLPQVAEVASLRSGDLDASPTGLPDSNPLQASSEAATDSLDSRMADVRSPIVDGHTSGDIASEYEASHMMTGDLQPDTMRSQNNSQSEKATLDFDKGSESGVHISLPAVTEPASKYVDSSAADAKFRDLESNLTGMPGGLPAASRNLDLPNGLSSYKSDEFASSGEVSEYPSTGSVSREISRDRGLGSDSRAAIRTDAELDEDIPGIDNSDISAQRRSALPRSLPQTNLAAQAPRDGHDAEEDLVQNPATAHFANGKTEGARPPVHSPHSGSAVGPSSPEAPPSDHFTSHPPEQMTDAHSESASKAQVQRDPNPSIGPAPVPPLDPDTTSGADLVPSSNVSLGTKDHFKSTESSNMEAGEKGVQAELERLRSRDRTLSEMMDSHMAALAATRLTMQEALEKVDLLEQTLSVKSKDAELAQANLEEERIARKHAEQNLEALRSAHGDLQTAHQELKNVRDEGTSGGSVLANATSSAAGVALGDQISTLIAQWNQFNGHQKQLSDSNSRIIALEKELSSLKTEHSRSIENQSQHELLRKQLADQVETNRGLKDQHATALEYMRLEHEKSSKEIESRHGHLQSQYQELESEYSKAIDLSKNQQLALTRTREELSHSRAEIQRLEEQLQDAKMAADRLDPDLSSASIGSSATGGNRQASLLVRDLRAQVVILEEERDELRNRVMQLKKAAIVNAE